MIAKSKIKAFSLVELMTIIIIVGILGMTAMPVYRKYVASVKISEAYTLMDAVGKSQIAFFHENEEFHDAVPSPVGLDQPMQFEDAQGWHELGYPIAIGVNLYFIYRARAGKTDDTGIELTNSTIDNAWTFTNIDNNTVLGGRYYNPPSQCNTGLGSPASLGATADPKNNWVLITAVGDLNGQRDPLCTVISRLLVASPSTEGKPAYTRDYFVMNKGD